MAIRFTGNYLLTLQMIPMYSTACCELCVECLGVNGAPATAQHRQHNVMFS